MQEGKGHLSNKNRDAAFCVSTISQEFLLARAVSESSLQSWSCSSASLPKAKMGKMSQRAEQVSGCSWAQHSPAASVSSMGMLGWSSFMSDCNSVISERVFGWAQTSLLNIWDPLERCVEVLWCLPRSYISPVFNLVLRSQQKNLSFPPLPEPRWTVISGKPLQGKWGLPGNYMVWFNWLPFLSWHGVLDSG